MRQINPMPEGAFERARRVFFGIPETPPEPISSAEPAQAEGDSEPKEVAPARI
jgi:hypothetical protein